MATLQFQREQLAKKLCVIKLKIQALRVGDICYISALQQLQDEQVRNEQLLQMIDQHLNLSSVVEFKTYEPKS